MDGALLDAGLNVTDEVHLATGCHFVDDFLHVAGLHVMDKSRWG